MHQKPGLYKGRLWVGVVRDTNLHRWLRVVFCELWYPKSWQKEKKACWKDWPVFKYVMAHWIMYQALSASDTQGPGQGAEDEVKVVSLWSKLNVSRWISKTPFRDGFPRLRLPKTRSKLHGLIHLKCMLGGLVKYHFETNFQAWDFAKQKVSFMAWYTCREHH